MTATHEPMSRHFSGGVEKPGAHQSRRQPVPIRPNFRPLLPKPCTHEPLEPNGIHIHTRASLNASRKRNSGSSIKVDVQKRRRPVVSTSKYARADPIHTVEPTSKTGHTGLAAGLYSYSNATPQYSPSPASDVSSPSPKSPSGTPPVMPKKPASQYAPGESGGISARTSPIDIPSQPTTVSTASIFAPINGTISPVSIAPESFTSERAGSFDSMRANIGYGATSPDQSSSASVSSVTIDPSSISIEGETMFDLGGGAASASASSAAGNVPDIASTDKLTPPYPPKNEAFSAYAVAGEFDDFSDIYFRNMSGSDYSSDSSRKLQSSSNTFNESIEVSEALSDPVTNESLDVGESEFSMLDFLAPSLDLF